MEHAFSNMMSNLEFLPSTLTLINTGTSPGQLSTCFILPVEDSIIDIFETLKNMAIIHQLGRGTGFSFNHLRTKGILRYNNSKEPMTNEEVSVFRETKNREFIEETASMY